jgi:uncharacterized protein YjbI with pentapeptide repeats
MATDRLEGIAATFRRLVSRRTLAVWWAVLGAFVFIILLLGSLFVLPPMLVDQTIALRKAKEPMVEKLTIADRLKAENDVRTTLLQAIGAVGAALAVVITWRQFQATLVSNREDSLNSQEQLRISQEGQVTERFTRAIDQLENTNLDVRLGGIYALERIAKDSARDHGPIMEVLTAFVRERAPWRRDQPPAAAGQILKPHIDIQAVLTVLGRRVIKPEWREPRLDLSWTDLRGADLRNTHLERVVIFESHLEQADLREAHLEGADLRAHLEYVDLSQAHLEGARLDYAYLEGGDLIEAHLEQADLRGADLERANLRGAHLKGAFIGAAQLKGAVNLTKEQIDSAYTTNYEQWQQARDKRLQTPESNQLAIANGD